jgi:hypothetical protein
VHGDSGGSYGGLGGGSAQGASYGLATLPLEPGSAGGWRGRGNYTTSAKGGGAIHLRAGGQMQIDGLLTANGGDGWYYRGAAGSGGSIFLAAMRCSGSGTLRIAIWQHLPLHVVEQRVAEQNVAGLFHFDSCSSFRGVLDTGVTSSILTYQAEEGSKGFYTVGATLIILR